jgi:1,2-diacylglycerol 3-beta-galactosyltransferase
VACAAARRTRRWVSPTTSPARCAWGDFFIGKPGPGCLSEAVHLGLPVITIRNAWTMPQERYNAQWVGKQGVGLVVPSLAKLPAAVEQMIGSLERFRAAAARIHNRAVFEIAQVLADLLVLRQAATRWTGAALPPRVTQLATAT